MPQLDPTPWFSFFILSWAVLYVLMPMKLSHIKKELKLSQSFLSHTLTKKTMHYPW